MRSGKIEKGEKRDRVSLKLNRRAGQESCRKRKRDVENASIQTANMPSLITSLLTATWRCRLDLVIVVGKRIGVPSVELYTHAISLVFRLPIL